MESDERTANIGLWKLRAFIELEIIRRPMRRKRDQWRLGLIANTNLLATVAAILRCQHQFVLRRIEIAIRPAVPGTVFDGHYFLSRKLDALFHCVEFGPIFVQLVATVLGDKQTARCIEIESFAISDATDITLLCRKNLASFVSVVFPNTSSGFKLGAGLIPERMGHPVLHLTCI